MDVNGVEYRFGVVFSHASEDTGGIVSGDFAHRQDAVDLATEVVQAQPGIEYIIVARTPDGTRMGGDWYAMGCEKLDVTRARLWGPTGDTIAVYAGPGNRLSAWVFPDMAEHYRSLGFQVVDR